MNNYYIENGVHTVLVTPFIKDTYDIDYDSLDKWIMVQTKSDVDGLVLLGSTSESGSLSTDEKMEIVKRVYSYNSILTNPKYITVSVSGSNDIRETIDFSIKCSKYCDALMITAPHYMKPPQKGIIEWFKTISNHPELTHMPILMYNIPGRTCINILPETMKIIYDECPNVIAVKEASGSLDQIAKILELIPNIKLFSGDDGMIVDVIKKGGVGVISVASNIFPNLITNITKLCMKHEFDQANILINDSKMYDLLIALFCETNPIPIKFILSYVKLYNYDCMRLPLMSLDIINHKKVIDAYTFTFNYSHDDIISMMDTDIIVSV
jgi:4-hydroxy-tetrahydrodipicolinate synthase